MGPEIQIFITIMVGIVVVGLVKYIFIRERGLVMTKENHFLVCDKAKTDIRIGIKEEFSDFRDYFKREVEFKVIESLRNLNGTLEKKIKAVVARQISILDKKIDSKLDIIDIINKLSPISKP